MTTLRRIVRWATYATAACGWTWIAFTSSGDAQLDLCRIAAGALVTLVALVLVHDERDES